MDEFASAAELPWAGHSDLLTGIDPLSKGVDIPAVQTDKSAQENKVNEFSRPALHGSEHYAIILAKKGVRSMPTEV